MERKDGTSSKFGDMDGEEQLRPRMAEHRWQGISMRDTVDADNAADTVTRRSEMGFIV